MPPTRGVRSAQRATTPQSPRRPPSSVGSPKQTRQSARSSSREVEPVPRQQQQQHDLEPELETVPEEHNSPELGAINPSLDISASAVSPSTQNESDHLNVADILEALPDLHDGARKVIQFFNRDDYEVEPLIQELSSGSAISKTFSRRIQYLISSRESFGDFVFITPGTISRKFPRSIDAKETLKPDAILYLANLAFFMATMFTGDAAQKREAFDLIDLNYPAAFMSVDPQSVFSTDLVAETVTFGISLRTQFFVMSAAKPQKKGPFDPDNALRDVFLNNNLDFKGLAVAGAEAGNYHEEIEERMRAIRAFFTTNPRSPIKLAELQEAFPLIEFLKDCVQWCKLRSQELEALIEEQHGAAGIVEGLTKDDAEEIVLESGQPGTAYDRAPAPRGPRQLRQAWGKNNANLARLKNLNLENAAGSTRVTMDSESQPQSMSVLGDSAGVSQNLEQLEEFSAPLDMDDQHIANLLASAEHDTLSTKTLTGNEILAKLALDHTNAGGRFIDPQPGAQRLSFDAPDTQQPRARSRDKRPATAASEDNDFETDTRQPPTKRARQDNIDPRLQNDELPEWEPNEPIPNQPTLLPPTPLNRPRQRTKPRLTNDVDLPSSSAPAAAPNIHSPMSSPVADGSNGDQLAFPASQEFRRIQQQAKDATRQSKLRASTMPEILGNTDDDNEGDLPAFTQRAERAAGSSGFQERRAWTPLEEDRLIALIGALGGPHYSRILKVDSEDEDPRVRRSLAHRSQVQLKDKARNIKFTYLKSGQRLPAGFGAVSIGKVMVKKLEEMGIKVEGDGREQGI